MKKVIVTSAWGAGYLEGGGMQWLNLHYLAGLRALATRHSGSMFLVHQRKAPKRSRD